MRILVVRVGRMGDMVMITPAVDALLEKYPKGEFTLLTSPEGRRVFRHFDARIGDIWEYRRKSWWPYPARARLRSAIRARRFDEIYLFETNPSYERLLHGAGSRVIALPPSDGAHFARRCLAVVDAGAAVRPVRLPLDDSARGRAAALLAEVGVEPETFVVGFHPSFSDRRALFPRRRTQRNKRWPVRSWGELGARLATEGVRRAMALRVLMDLTPEDRGLGQAIVEASGGSVTLMTPRPDFERYKATLARMDLLVTPDTGPMHVAAALGTPVVALFHGTHPDECGPFTSAERREVLRAEDSPGAERLGLAALEVERVFESCLVFLPGPR